MNFEKVNMIEELFKSFKSGLSVTYVVHKALLVLPLFHV